MDPFTSARWAEIDDLFARALDRPPDERTAFLRATCGDEPALYRAVADLLASDAAAEQALGEHAADFAAHLLNAAATKRDLDLAPGTPVGPYRIEGELGRGGMGTVYRAARADGTFEKTVALKLVKRGMDTDEVLRRFRYERQILAGLDHPHIAHLLDAGAHGDGRPYLVMELVEGVPITTYCDRHGLDLDARLALFEPVCEAVAYAHRHLVVHRDLKPSNILVTADGAVKLLDFGIARLLDEDSDAPRTRIGQRILTPEYAAPEQLRGGSVTTATDVYALGVLLFELLAGRRPASPTERPSEVAPPDRRRALRGDLNTLVATALHSDPAHRYPTAEALRDDLVRRRTGRPLRARPTSRSYRARKFVARHQWGVGVSVAAVLALVAFALTVSVEQRRTARALADAEATAGFLENLLAAADPFAPERADTLRVRDLLARGADAAERDLADQPARLARMLTLIGRGHHQLGGYDEAERVLRRALDLDAVPTLVRAETGVRLAATLYDRGAYAEADTLLRNALAVQRAERGDDDLDVSQTLNDLGLVRAAQGEHEEAVALHRQALALQRRLLAEPDPEIATSSKNLADALRRLGQTDEAEGLLRESVAQRRRLFGDEHPSVSVGLHSLAGLLRDAGRHAEAEPVVREALAINRAALGDGHPHVADNLTLLGSVLRNLGRTDEAADVFGEAVAHVRALHGDRHPDVALALYTYAGLLTATEDYETAESVMREAVGIARETLGEGHPAVGFNLTRLARTVHEGGEPARALPIYREALAVLQPRLGDGNLHVALLQGHLGGCLADLGRYAEAEGPLQASREALEALHGPEHKRVRWARESLADLYEAWGRPTDAARYRALAES